MRYRYRALLLLGLCLAAGTAAAGSIYRWTDSSGEVHYGDRPGAPGARAIAQPQAPPPVTEDPDRAAHERLTRGLLRAYAIDHAEARAAAEKARRAAQRRKRNCAVARDRLRGYRNANYLYRYNADGKRVILSNAARAKMIVAARRAVGHWCAPQGGN